MNLIVDPDLGPLKWDPELEWWEGSIRLSGDEPYRLYVLARYTADYHITSEAREAIRRIKLEEESCRRYAAAELLQVHTEEWADGAILTAQEFARRLVPDSLEVHESGYAELHFGDGGLFHGHGVGVRIRPDGSFQEAVLEG